MEGVGRGASRAARRAVSTVTVRAGRRRPIPVAAASPRWAACYAPHGSLYFDQLGKVRACCQNTGVYLGDVAAGQSLRDIWSSAEAERMRTALEDDSYDAGCEFCGWQVREGNRDEAIFARWFDAVGPDEGRRNRWPKQMEFSLTNTCNLQCVMCNGDWSSTIRAKRELRSPLPVVYGDAFFEQLAEFLPHLESAKFLGGEPFLGAEPLRVMEMLAELPKPPAVAITTNGTVNTARVARIIEALQPSIVVSIDGASAATYERIRVGADFARVIENLDRFIEVLGPDWVSIAHCLMTDNWHEFADLLHLAEERSLFVGVNVVRFPERNSLYQLPVDELDHVVASLRATEVSLTGKRLATWRDTLDALAHRAEHLRSDPGPDDGAHGTAARSLGLAEEPSPIPAMASEPPGGSAPVPWLPFARFRPGAAEPDPSPGPGAAVVDIDLDGAVEVVQPGTDAPVDVADAPALGAERFGQRLIDAWGPTSTWVVGERRSPEDDERFWMLLGADGPEPALRITATARRDAAGTLVGGRFVLATEPSSGASGPPVG